MLTGKVQTAIKATALFVFVLFAAAAGTQAQSFKQMVNSKSYTTGLQNLRAGIVSDNLGVRKSAIYFAGKYHVSELTNDLLAQLQRESDANSRILIGMSIYTLGEKKGIEDLQTYATTEKNPRVKRMLEEICNQFNFNTSSNIVSVVE